MYKLKRLLVGLDFTNIDKAVIGYTAFISNIIQPSKIYFLNIQRNLDVPEGVRENFPELNQPLDEKFKQQMEKDVKTNFPDFGKYDIEYSVVEGSPFDEMLRWSHIKNIDLLITGKKPENEGSGVMVQRLARKAMCSILFVPGEVTTTLKKILVPVDFSENSEMAAENACALAKAHPETKVVFHHVFELPTGYYKTGKTAEEFSAIMREHALTKYQEFVKKLNIPSEKVSEIIELETDISTGGMIMLAASHINASLIVIGAKGRTNATAILLGSITEKVMSKNNSIPMLVVKQKEKSFNFLEFIKNV